MQPRYGDASQFPLVTKDEKVGIVCVLTHSVKEELEEMKQIIEECGEVLYNV